MSDPYYDPGDPTSREPLILILGDPKSVLSDSVRRHCLFGIVSDWNVLFSNKEWIRFRSRLQGVVRRKVPSTEGSLSLSS